MNSLTFIRLSIAMALLGSLAHAQTATWSYDFNSQWDGTWVVNDRTGTSPVMNYSKQDEGRIGGAGGNILGGTVGLVPGTVGSVSALYTPSTFNLLAPGSSVNLKESWSAFANQASYATGTGTSQVFQIGFLSNPSSSSTLSVGDSLYFGAIERSWNGQNLSAPYPGSAELELGIFRDGSLLTSFGTYTIDHYGARVGSEVYAKWLEMDITWTNIGGGQFGYTVGVNTLDFYTPAIGANNITEGTPQTLGVWSGTVNPDLASLSNLTLALGADIAPGGDVSVSGMTWDFSNAQVVPEPGSVMLVGVAGTFLWFRRRRRA